MIQCNFTDVDKQESYVGSEPVSLDEAKAHCRIDFDDDDALVGALITAARQAIEDYCHISIVPKTITLTLEAAEQLRSIFAQPYQVREQWNSFELPYGPTQAVLSVTSIGSDGTTVLSCVLNQDYYLTGVAFKTIKIINSFSNNILVYTVGYATVPQALKQAILNEVAYRYESRGEGGNVRATAFTEQGVGIAAQVIAAPFRRMNLL